MSVTNLKPVAKNFYNQKFYRQDFSGQDLQKANFANASLLECNFTNADLSYATFEGANCRGANFTGSRLYRTNFKDAALAQSKFEPKDAFGMTITLSCETVDGMKIGKMWWFVWLMMCLRMDCPDKETELKIISAIGPERYEGLARLFSRRLF